MLYGSSKLLLVIGQQILTYPQSVSRVKHFIFNYKPVVREYENELQLSGLKTTQIPMHVIVKQLLMIKFCKICMVTKLNSNIHAKRSIEFLYHLNLTKLYHK